MEYTLMNEYQTPLNEETLKRYENIKKISIEKNCTIGNIVIAAMVSNRDFDTFPIIGCKTAEQLKDSMAGSGILLSEDEMNFIFNR